MDSVLTIVLTTLLVCLVQTAFNFIKDRLSGKGKKK